MAYQSPLCPDGDQIPQRNEMTRCAKSRSREFTSSALAREKNGRLPDQRSGSPRREEVAPGPTRVRRKSEPERAEYAREGEVLIDSETPEDTEDRAAQLRRGLGRQRLRIQSADNFVKLRASQSDRMFVVRCSLFAVAVALFGSSGTASPREEWS